MMEYFTIEDRRERVNSFLVNEYGAPLPDATNEGDVLVLDRICEDMTTKGISEALVEEFEMLLLGMLHAIDRHDDREQQLEARIRELEAQLGYDIGSNYAQAGD